MNFDELRIAVFSLYQQKAYGEALSLLDREYRNFPGRAQSTAHWRVALAALSGQTEAALRLFAEAVAEGLWWSPSILTSDSDLAALHGMAEFDRLVAVCADRAAAAQAAAVPVRLTLNPPDADTRPFPLMIAMHGNNQNARIAEESWGGLSGAGWRVALLQSTQIVGKDTYIWNDRTRAVAEVGRHSAELLAEPDADRKRVLFGGFSMGGGLAIYLALSGMAAARGFVAVGPWLDDTAADLRPLLEAGVPQGFRGYIIVGDEDQHCHKVSLEVRDLLAEYGVPCELEVHEGLGHAYPAGFAGSLERATRFILA